MAKNTAPENTAPENTAPEAVEREYIVDSPAGLNLRDAPFGKLLVVLPNKCGLIGQCSFENLEWMKVRTGALHGWVMRKYLLAVQTEVER